MILVTKSLLESCAAYTKSEAAVLAAVATADVLLLACEAAIEAKGARPREWWVARMGLNGIVTHFFDTKILIQEDNELLFCPEGPDAKLVGAGVDLEWFETFWKAYKPGPGLTGKAKGARAAALKSWGRIKKMDRKLFDRIISAVTSEVASGWSGSNGHNPHATTWLNQRRWEDVEASPEAPGSTESGDQALSKRQDTLLQKMRGML